LEPDEEARLSADHRAERDRVDGQIPACQLGGWGKFHKLVTDGRFERDSFAFRGQRRYDWDLVPSLARGAAGGTFTRDDSQFHLESFRRAARGRKDADPKLDAEDEMWALGQHHGLRTPLLDWTLSPYVALFFAFERGDERSEKANTSRIVHILNLSKIKTLIEDLSVRGDPEHLQIVQPIGDSNKRLLSQAGLFVLVPPGETVVSWIMTNDPDAAGNPELLSEYLLKVHIDNKGREECLRALHRMNIHHASLFPDLTGSCSYSNFDFDIYRPRSARSSAVAGRRR
jgi:hypothetical protein